jgi:hypothetical protein
MEQNYFLFPYKKTPHSKFPKFFLYQLNTLSLSYFINFSLSYFISLFFFFSSLPLSRFLHKLPQIPPLSPPPPRPPQSSPQIPPFLSPPGVRHDPF